MNHHKYNSNTDSYEEYEDLFDPMQTDRQARRKRKPRAHHIPKKQTQEIVEEIADADLVEAGFNTTYRPGPFEEGWLLSSLRTFFEQDLISDVLGRVKGGKEASVYRCEAHPSAGSGMVAAKVYRPRMFRNLRNDKLYRDGREVLTGSGHVVRKNDHRVMRALNKKTEFGVQVQHTSWLMYEFTTLERLYKAGAAVPEPIAHGDNTILMSYHGNEQIGAPTLNEVALDEEEAALLFREVMKNVEIMLEHNLIHGDLSAYNILYWQGEITIIDFPQVVEPQSNSHARAILERDVKRVCEYFARYGVKCNHETLANALWQRYAEPASHIKQADLSRLFGDENV